MKKLIFNLICLGALSQPVRAVAEPPGILVVRILESGVSAKAIITRGEGASEKVEFSRGASDKHLTESSEGYFKLFQRLYQEGYALQSTFSTSEVNERYITLLFVKKQ